MKVYIYDPKKKRKVLAGEYDDKTKEYVRVVKPKHYMRHVKGYGLQEDVIAGLQCVGCETIRLKRETDDLVSRFQDWLEPDIRVADYGHGKQRFMPQERMEVCSPE